MKKGKFKIEDIKIGNHVRFKRQGVNDFEMEWTVINFYNDMIQIKIDEMGFKDELYIDVDDIESLINVNDTRYSKK